FDVALSLVHEIAEGFEDALPHDGAVKEKVIFSRECIVTMTTITEAETFSNKKGFFYNVLD
uniref:Uncharacterized protein n=1 Tax=Romanomermis culicivorax TaxID=13658 RepID=A0A915KFS1_ROMCU